MEISWLELFFCCWIERKYRHTNPLENVQNLSKHCISHITHRFLSQVFSSRSTVRRKKTSQIQRETDEIDWKFPRNVKIIESVVLRIRVYLFCYIKSPETVHRAQEKKINKWIDEWHTNFCAVYNSILKDVSI